MQKPAFAPDLDGPIALWDECPISSLSGSKRSIRGRPGPPRHDRAVVASESHEECPGNRQNVSAEALAGIQRRSGWDVPGRMTGRIDPCHATRGNRPYRKPC